MLYEYVESQVISSLLVSNNDTHLDYSFSILSQQDFEKKEYKILYDTIKETYTNNKHVSLDSIVFLLEKNGDIDNIGGVGFLHSLYKDGYHNLATNSLLESCKLLKELSNKRKANSVIRKYVDNVFVENSGQNTLEGLLRLQDELDSLSLNASENNGEFSVNLRTVSEDYKKVLFERGNIAGESSIVGIPTFIPRLDDITNGWLPSQLIAVGARPGIGKSVFAINSAISAAKNGKNVLYFNFEMDSNDLLDRLYSALSLVPMYRIRKGINNNKEGLCLTRKEQETLFDTIKDVEKLNIQIESNPTLNVAQIRNIAMKCYKEQGLDFIIIDYLQLITPTVGIVNRQEMVQDISRNLKLLAKELKIPIMIVVQLNREKSITNKNGEPVDQIPSLRDIRESGAIANDSDVVVLIHRNTSVDQRDLAKLIVAKNRNGQSGDVIDCIAQLECSLFLQASMSHEQLVQDDSLDDMIDDIEGVFDDLDNIVLNSDSNINQQLSLQDTVDVLSNSNSDSDSIGDGVDLSGDDWL